MDSGPITKSITKKEEEYWENVEEFEWLASTGISDVLSRIPLPRGRVLELCSGSGMFTKNLDLTNTSEYTCLDISNTLLKRLSKDLPGIKTVKDDAQKPSFKKESFNQIYIFGGLHHLPDRESCIKNNFTLLKEGGSFTCLEPNADCFYRGLILRLRKQLGLYTEDEVFLRSGDIIAMLRSAGYTDIRAEFITPNYNPKHIKRLYPLFLLMKLISVFPGKLFQTFFIITAEKGKKGAYHEKI